MRRYYKNGFNTLAHLVLAMIISLGVLGCTGSSDDGDKSTTPPAEKTYSVGGVVTGQSGNLTLRNNGAESLTVETASHSFTFPGKLKSGQSYSVSVYSPPNGQKCVVSNGSGKVASANVSNIAVACSNKLGKVNSANLKGVVVDATIAFARVDLKKVGSATSLGSVTTDATGKFDFTSVDLSESAVSETDVLYLEVTGQGADCSSGATYADINQNGSFDSSGDSCLKDRAKPILKSYVGTVSLLQYLGRERDSSTVDTTMLSTLVVSHLSTAKAGLVDDLNDSSGDVTAKKEKATYLLNVLENRFETSEGLKKQVAILATTARAIIHESAGTPAYLVSIAGTDGVTGLLGKMIQGDVTMDATFDGFITNELAADPRGMIPLAYGIGSTTNLSGVSFANTELTSAMTDFAATKTKSAAFKTALKALSWVKPTTEAEVTQYRSNYLHSEFLKNGQTGEQRFSRLLARYTRNPVIDEVVLQANLLRSAVTGKKFYNVTTHAFSDATGDLPVYHVSKRVLRKYYSGQFEIEKVLGDYAVLDNNEIKLLGNQNNFQIRFAAESSDGNRRIRLQVFDPQQDAKGGRNKINQIKVDVTGDATLGTLTLLQKLWRPWSKFTYYYYKTYKNTCTDADASTDYLYYTTVCLNRFYIKREKDASNDAFWGHQMEPGKNEVSDSYLLPLAWNPTTGSTYSFSINYDDTVLTNTNLTTSVQRKLGPFWDASYLPKLVSDNGELITEAVVGNNSQLSVNPSG